MFFRAIEPQPASEADLAQFAGRFSISAEDVSAGGMAQRFAAAVFGTPGDFDATFVATAVPDIETGIGENGFLLMLTGCGVRYVGNVSHLPLATALQPTCFAVPQDRSGNLDFSESHFLVAVSATECAVFDALGTFQSVHAITDVAADLERSGGKPMLLEIQPSSCPVTDRLQSQPLYRRPLWDIVPPHEAPRAAFEHRMVDIIDHPGFGNEDEMRKLCHVHEYDIYIKNIRMFRVISRKNTRYDHQNVATPYIWLMTQSQSGRLKPIGGRNKPAIYIDPNWRGSGLGAELCLAAHDDPFFRDEGMPGSRTIGSHRAWRLAHRLAVERALGRGLDVPEAVLADYQDLTAPTPGT